MLKHLMPLVALSLAASMGAAEPTITAVQVRDNIYMLQGPGGNIGLVIGDDATFLIDDKFGETLPAVLDAVAAITERPVDFVLNTHYHGDHTGGNPALRESGAWTLAQANVRQRMATDADLAPSALPVITYHESMSFFMDGVDVRIQHVAAAHTDGDSVVYLDGADVIHSGDAMFNHLFPYIDVDGGGGVDGTIHAMEQILDAMGPDTIVIPGHGELADRQDVLTYLMLLRDSRAAVAERLARGETADQIVAADLVADYADWNWAFIDAEKYIRSLVASIEAGR